MSDKTDWQKDLIDKLRERANRKPPDRATLAELRRCLGGDLVRGLARVGWLFSRVQGYYALEDAMLVAALFASYPVHTPDVSLGAAFRKVGDSDSVEKRFVALLDCEREDLPGRLRQAVSLLRSKTGTGLDWEMLLADLRRWDSPARRVQQRWARDFWAAPSPEPRSDQTVPEPQVIV